MIVVFCATFVGVENGGTGAVCGGGDVWCVVVNVVCGGECGVWW